MIKLKGKAMTLIKLIGYLLILSIVLIALIKITHEMGGLLKDVVKSILGG